MIIEGEDVGKALRHLLEGGSDKLPIIMLTVKGGPSGYHIFDMMSLEIIRQNCTVSDKMITLATGQYFLGKKGQFAWLASGEDIPNGIDPIIKIQTRGQSAAWEWD